MNDIQRLKDYRDAVASVRIPRLESAKLSQYANAARTAALDTIDAALEMTTAPAMTAEIIDESEARNRGMIPVTVVMPREAPELRTVLADMRRGESVHALVIEDQIKSAESQWVAVWRIPA